jgi:hypothetical protein
MHRRTLLRTLAGAALLPTIPLLTRAQGIPDATPGAPPQHHGLPRPVVLGDGIELIDYRIYPSPDVPRIIGEIVNIGDKTVDAPVVSVSFEELGPDGLAYAPPFIPVMRPGESNLIFGVLPNEITTNEQLAAGRFSVCAPIGPGEYAVRLQALDLQLTVAEELYWADSLNVTGSVQNAGSAAATQSAINGMIRDLNGRYIGVCVEHTLPDIAPGETIEFMLWAFANTSVADAYLFLNGSTDYTVQVVAGPARPVIAPSCPALFT